MPIRSRIRTIPDYPKPGIQFRDVTTLFKDEEGFRIAIEQLVEPYRDLKIDKVAGIEARGFILAAPVAFVLQAGFVPIRKKGKLPGETIRREYELEYGFDQVEIHVDAFQPEDQVLLVDDLIATGGTAEAAVDLIEETGARIVACSFVVDLPDLGGSARLQERGHTVRSLCHFEGD